MAAPGEMRRCLVGLLMIGCVFLFYMFWNQPASPTSVPLQSFVPVAAPKVEAASVDTRWTWICENKLCVRKDAGERDHHVSLTTCSMLCGASQLWPASTGPTRLGSHAVGFSHDALEFESDAAEPARSYIQYSFAVFNSNVLSLIEPHQQQQQQRLREEETIKKLRVMVRVSDSEHVRLQLATDESYKLSLHLDGSGRHMLATVTATNFFGARHGLETLSQLIWWDTFAHSLRIVAAASVEDAPRFAYRGLMIDTARNYMPIDALKRTMVGMAANKLNVFHWHVSDSQSFPLVLPSVPQLAKHGAYSPDAVYTAEQVQDLVEYARLRGIRVVIEVDVPAHVGNGWTWGPAEGLGELVVCVNVQPWTMYCGEPPCGQLNPDNPHVYDVLEKIYRDIIALTGETEIFHIGGDEVNLECWSQYRNRSSTSSAAYVDLNDVWGNFTLEALRRLAVANGGKKPRHVVIWSSNLTKRPYLGKYLNRSEVVVQAWGGSDWTETPELVAGGYGVILSHVDAWYLDCGYGRWRENGGAACDPYRPWQTLYRHQPWVGDALYQKHMLGGEACLWTEQVDELSLDTRLWPRAAAFAERMWSDPTEPRSASIGGGVGGNNPDGVRPPATTVFTNMDEVYARITIHRERLRSRGLRNEALWPQWCTHNPGMCL